jgi:hypothetical protein
MNSEIEDLVVKWSKVGLLEKLPLTEKIKISKYLETTANRLVMWANSEKGEINKNSEFYSGILLPAVRRGLAYSNKDIESFLNEFEEKIPKLNDDYEKFKIMFPNHYKKFEDEFGREWLHDEFGIYYN